MLTERTLKILVADDDETNRLLLRLMLTKEGYNVVLAENGQEAVTIFTNEHPDIILMDIMMPIMNGYDAVRKIKSQSSNYFIPVIFITAITDAESLAKCVECGGDDFLTKPYDRVIIKAKIDAMVRVKNLYETLRIQSDELSQHHERLQLEYEFAEKVFSNVVDTKALNLPNIKYRMSPMTISNGDLVLVAKKPSGGQHIMLGDFTGHGLSAAIGAIPVSDIFYSMTSKGFSILDIVIEINTKLHTRLPTGLFLAACFIELDESHCSISIWNGGLPDVLIFNRNSGIHNRIPSSRPPLGILDSKQMDKSVVILGVEQGDHIFVYSDGVIEVCNPDGEMYGQDRLEKQLSFTKNGSDYLLENIYQNLIEFQNGAEQSDDITLIEILCDATLGHYNTDTGNEKYRPKNATHWNLSLELSPDSIRLMDPVQTLLKELMDIQNLYEHKTRIFTILAELYNNALDYGLLNLDSKLRSSPNSYFNYYVLREKSLVNLNEGWINFSINHSSCPKGGKLVIRVQDSGNGFDHCSTPSDFDNNERFSGRGIALVRSLCESVKYQGKGNCVEATYVWSTSPSYLQ